MGLSYADIQEVTFRLCVQDSREMVAPPAEAMGDGDWATTKARFDERKNAGRQ